MSAPDNAPAKLERVLGVGGVAFASFNCIVGVGIFGLPGLVSGVLGPAAIAAYAICLMLVGLLGLCFAEAGSRVSGSGGLYAYASAAFGPVVGGVAGALLLFASSIASAAAVARFFLDTLATHFPVLSQPIITLILLVVLYTLLAAVNIRGVRDGARLSLGIGLIKFAPLILLVVAGVFFIDPAELAWPSAPAGAQLGQGTLLLFFAFMGVEAGLNVSGEMRDPARTVPRALLLALGMVGLLYIGLQTVAQGVLGAQLANAQSPLVDLGNALFGPLGGRLVMVAVLLSAGGYLVADMMSSPRAAFALAEAGQLPRFIAYVHPRFHTPAVAIGLYAAAVVTLAATGTFEQIAVFAVAGTLVVYMTACLGVLRLRAKGIAQAGPPFVAPGGRAVPLIAAGIMIWLLSSLSLRELLMTGGFIIVVALIYGIKTRRQPSADHG